LNSTLKNLALLTAVITATSTGAAQAADSKDSMNDSAAMQKAEGLYQAASKTGEVSAFKSAENAYREVIRTEPDNAKAHQRLGAVMAAIGTVTPDEKGRKEIDDTAILEEKQAIKLDPKYFLPHVVLGQIYANRGQFDESVKEFQQAIALKPDSFRSHLDLGIAYMHIQKEAEALKAFERAAELKPDEPTAFINVGVLKQSLGDFKGAVEAEKKALAMKNLDARQINAANFNLGNIYADMKDADNAIAAYQAALKVRPNHMLSLSGIGWMQSLKGDYDAAISTQRKVLKTAKGDAMMESIARSRLATTLADQGNKAEAEKEFEKCMTLKPQSPLMMMEYGRYLEKNGKKDQAKTLFKQALTIQPTFKPAKEALAKLETETQTK